MRKIYKIMFAVSMVLMVLSAVAIVTFGFNFGVDFTGGSILEIEFKNDRPSNSEITSVLAVANISDEISYSPTGEKGMLIRTGELSETQHQDALRTLNEEFGGVEEKRFYSVGPTIGEELKSKSVTAIVVVLIAILTYIAFVFRQLSKTLSMVGMTVGTVLALLHDILIPLGVFALLGHYHGVQISAVFVAAILTILGYTVSDKVVIYDRVRENILKGAQGNLAEVIHRSVMQTLIRSINNTLTVTLSSAAIYFFGGESIRYFALALIIGILSGAYSSIFVSSPVLAWWGKGKKGTNS